MSETNTVSATELQPVMKHVRTSITDFGKGLAGPPLDAHGDETMTLDENLQHAADAWNQSTAELGRVCGDSLANSTTVSIDQMGS